eukprot:EG_transcript_10868
MAAQGVPTAVALGSAMIGNTCTMLMTFPLDTIKTRQQTASGPAALNYTRGLFRGLTPTLLATTPGSGLYFATFEYLQQRYNAGETLRGDLACACASQLLPGALVIPGDMLKVNLQTGTYPNMRMAMQAMLHNVNWRQTLRAMRPKLFLSYFRDFSFVTIQMTLYVQLYRKGDNIAFFAGALAAGTASLLTTPLDTLRTRHMLAVDSALKSGAMTEANYFAGTVPRVALAALSGMIFFRCYEVSKRVLLRTTAAPRAQGLEGVPQ